MMNGENQLFAIANSSKNTSGKLMQIGFEQSKILVNYYDSQIDCFYAKADEE